MISIKRSMDRLSQAEELAQRDAAHRDAHDALLGALDSAAGEIAGEAAQGFQRRLDQLRRDLGLDLSPPGVEQKSDEVRRELAGFAADRARDRERRAWECKQIVRMAAEATAAIAHSGASQNSKLRRLAAGIDAVAALDDIRDLRVALAARVNEIKVLAATVESESQSRAAQLQSQLQRAEQRMADAEKMACTDALTGLGNRRQAEQAMVAAIAAQRRFSVLVCDLDRFKAINDTHGHQQGDAALQAAARALRQRLRPADTVCRWGGDEFLALLWDAPLAMAEKLAAGLHAKPLVRIPVAAEGRETLLPVGASAGAAEFMPGETIDDCFERADRAMYNGKVARATAPAAPPAPSGPAIGAFVAHNRTGGAMTIELDGRCYAVEAGTFTLPLPVGRYTAVVRAREQKSFIAFQIHSGATYTGNWD